MNTQKSTRNEIAAEAIDKDDDDDSWAVEQAFGFRVE